ncbi:branched-chain amino acid ABC transporter permease [Notoacmeibacter marinus]|uniref:Branched-chain amino acid ABC transporter permease n=1 Tax=Notoacmeibacter marinus TaxID=1876515 RepID=A0A231V212_9HYPH|nr:branched-chain amino acid ABC transporter permease [Notoacmeibacter marinus]OXT02180.1 branched-chain amino acid ABC transporter permease [Notoacmeibacter marinus]
MTFFLEQLIIGLSSGGIYAIMALALVMIYKSTGHVNLAQGEMAVFSTFIAWTLVQTGMPLWPAILLTVAVSFVGAIVLERVVVRPFAEADDLVVVAVFVGLFLSIHSLAGAIWNYEVKPFPSAFSDGSVSLMVDLSIRTHTLGSLVTTGAVLTAVWIFFRYTQLGLALRAAADNRESSRLVGINVSLMLALGWGLAAGIGAVAGVMIAPVTFLDPGMGLAPLIFALAGALLGGITSPFGAALGGLIVGVLEAMISAYVPYGIEFRELIALMLILSVLLVRPAGLFGEIVARRV